MKNRKIIVSAVLLTLLNTGCVKPTEEVNNTAQGDNSNGGETVVYTEQPNSVTYEESAPIVYSDPTATETTTIASSNISYFLTQHFMLPNSTPHPVILCFMSVYKWIAWPTCCHNAL